MNLQKIDSVFGCFCLFVFLCSSFPTFVQAQAGKKATPVEHCRIAVGENVQVSNEDGGTWETYVAVNPRNPKNLIASGIRFNHIPGTDRQSNVFFYSIDGGKTWQNHSPVFGGDPVVAFSKRGTAFFLNYAVQGNLLHFSLDGGRTLGPPEVIGSRLDHWMPATDLSEGPYGGNVYLFAKGGGEGGVDLLRTRTDGKDWTRVKVARDIDLTEQPTPKFEVKDGVVVTPKPVQREPVFLQTWNDGIRVARSGRLYLFFLSFTSQGGRQPQQHWMTTSDNGGQTFATPRGFFQANGSRLFGPEVSFRRAAVGIDHSGGVYDGRLYVTWREKDAEGRSILLYSHSSDEGRTWEPPRMNPLQEIAGLDEWWDDDLPTIAVNNKGVVLFTSYVFRSGAWSTGPDGKETRPISYQYYAAASVDGGKTFLAPGAISAESKFDSVKGKKLRDGRIPEGVFGERTNDFRLGDYQNTASGSNGVFHPLWMDRRTGEQQMWYAPVRVLCNGKPAIAK